MANRLKSIQLMADNCGLRIIPDKNEWSKVSLLLDNTERPLGGETYKSITTKLIKFLSEDNIQSSVRQWILTLSELHHVFYGIQTNDGALNHDQIREWINILRPI
jgi:hypothetical protein